MSTVEIAELTGKEYFHVLRDAEVMLADLKLRALSFEGTHFTAQGNAERCLNLPKLECLTLVSGYSVELRYRNTGRRLELEAQAAASGFRRSLAARRPVPLTRP